MSPEQSQYDFIMNPGKPPKKPLVPTLGDGAPMTRRILFVVGGGLVLIAVLWVVSTILFGGDNNAGITKIVQQEEEIARVATEGTEASRADIRGAATNTQLSLNSQQQEWLLFLAEGGTEVGEEQQKLLQNAGTDQQLETARANNTFDKTFLDVMRSYLTDYASTLQTTFNATSNVTEQALLKSHFDQTQLLLEQLPKS